MNKSFAEMPAAFKAFIDQYFKSIDVDGNFLVKKNEIWACANCSLVKIREKYCASSFKAKFILASICFCLSHLHFFVIATE